MQQKLPITRRKALRGIAGASSLTALGAGATIFAAQPAAAASVNIGGVKVSTQDGDLSFVDLDLTDYFARWRNFDLPVAAVAFRDVLVFPQQSGIQKQEHVLFDQTGEPVLLWNISSNGDGSDGWGGPGEWASTNPNAGAANTAHPTEDDYPDNLLSGAVHADVWWRLAEDSDADGSGSDASRSTPDPAVFGDTFPNLDNDEDGSTKKYRWRLRKQVYFYTLEDNGRTPVTSEDTFGDGREVYPMGADDGTFEFVEATPGFDVAVENLPASTSADGDGSTSGG